MQFSFDASTVAPETGEGGGFIPVSNDPRGTLVVVTDAGDGNGNLMVANKAQTGAFMPLKLKVLEGPDAGKEGILRLNLQNDKHTTVSRAYAELSAICHCTGVMRINQSIAEIFNKPFRLVSELQDSNKPDGYTQLANGGIRDANGAKAGKAGQGPQVAQTAQQQPAQQFQQHTGPGAAGNGWGGAPQQQQFQQQPPVQQQQQFQQPPQQQQFQPGPQVEVGPASTFQQPPQGQQQIAQGAPGNNWATQQQQPPAQQQPGNWANGGNGGGGAPSWATTPGQ